MYRLSCFAIALFLLAVNACPGSHLYAAPQESEDQPSPQPATTDSGPDAVPEPEVEVDYARDLLPALKTYCYKCHSGPQVEADFSLEKYTDNTAVFENRTQWNTVLMMIETRQMPPEGEKQPTEDERFEMTLTISDILNQFDCSKQGNVGRVTSRRLNRTEYNNTIRDLIGINFKPADDFPADDVGYGFDNIGDVLSVSPLLIEKYLDAAEKILDRAIVVYDPPVARKQTWPIARHGTLDASHAKAQRYLSFDAGTYRIRARIKAQAGHAPIALRVGDQLHKIDMATADGDGWVEYKLPVTPGTFPVGVEWFTESKSASSTLTQGRSSGTDDRTSTSTATVELIAIETEGPFDAPRPELPASHRLLMDHRPELSGRDAALEIMTRFCTRAFRRPATATEIEKCMQFYDQQASQGQRFEECVKAAMMRVLVSAPFLFRLEFDPAGVEPGSAYAINEYELASRLSYFLWNSMPDDTLMQLASEGKLREDLDHQVKRMIQDPRSNAFLNNFCQQWLLLRKLDLAEPDPESFPDFDDALRNAMIRESELFFQEVARKDGSVLDLLIANFTYVNERLAKHYGIKGVKGRSFVRVTSPAERGGILTQASVLTLTSNATRTSPVKRGKFVLEQILNMPPPPPPPNVPDLESQNELKGTLRQQMEQHRENALCASCHARMDPLGFAFENFDATGAWRTKDAGLPVDASGELPDGRQFTGATGLKQLILEEKELFVACVVEKMLTFALGRGVEPFDRCAIDAIVTRAGDQDYRFSAIVNEIVHSDPFQRRTAAGAP